MQVHGLSDAVDLRVGMAHACAARKDGGVHCWGYNSYGTLGDGTTIDSPLPIEVQGVDDAVEVAAGGFHTCVRDGAGEVTCWGDNRSGQLGLPPGELSTGPVIVAGLPPVVDLSAGMAHTCAIDEDGGVWCWGDNTSGILGNGQFGGSYPTPTRVLGLNGVTSIDGGFIHTCATRSDGTAWCWGSNRAYFGSPRGQLGNGSFERSSTPVRVVGLSDAVEVTAGFEHTCAVRASGSVACWGKGDVGQLGNGAPLGNGGTPGYWTVPLEVVELRDAVGVSAEFDRSCAVRAGGRVSCWGSNVGGRLGAGDDEPYHPRPVTVWPTN